MLSETERKILEDIERHLYLDDLQPARSLMHGPTTPHTYGPTTPAAAQRWSWGYPVIMVVLGALLALLVVGLVLGLLILAFVAAELVGMLLAGRWLYRTWWSRCVPAHR